MVLVIADSGKHYLFCPRCRSITLARLEGAEFGMCWHVLAFIRMFWHTFGMYVWRLRMCQT